MIELIITAVFAAALLADVDERPSRKRINRLRHIYEYKKYDKVCSRPGCTDMRDIRGARQHMSARHHKSADNRLCPAGCRACSCYERWRNSIYA